MTRKEKRKKIQALVSEIEKILEVGQTTGRFLIMWNEIVILNVPLLGDNHFCQIGLISSEPELANFEVLTNIEQSEITIIQHIDTPVSDAYLEYFSSFKQEVKEES